MRSSHSGPVASRAIGRTGIRSVVWERLRTLRDIAPRAAALLGCVGREALLVVYGGGGTPNGRLACPPLFVSRPASELLAQTLAPALVGVASKLVCARIRPAARALESLRSPFRRIRLRGRPGRRQGLGALRTTHCKRSTQGTCSRDAMVRVERSNRGGARPSTELSAGMRVHGAPTERTRSFDSFFA